MGKTKINAKILADSKDNRGNRITTFLLTYPRFIHSELLTHRVFSRNSASSRAIPFKRMLDSVMKNPFVPIAWQKSHNGMQGSEYIKDTSLLEHLWLLARDEAVKKADGLNKMGVTKQICNRLLEPFMWHTCLVTATEWDNFFELRTPKFRRGSEYNTLIFNSKEDFISYYKKINASDGNSLYGKDFYFWETFNKALAEIHIQALAEAMWDARNKSTPKELKAGEWHMPFGDKVTVNEIINLYNKEFDSNITQDYIDKIRVKIATARDARLSYMTFDKKIDYYKDIKLHDKLKKDRHMSPFEHCAVCMSDEEYNSFIRGDLAYAHSKKHYNKLNKIPSQALGWCNNFKGFIPYRYLVEHNLL